jgi:tRNA-2-methylthio-N6-dimethylallyladenosine synthase
VDSYHWHSGTDGESACCFADLLAKVAGISSLLRVRFSTSHPKDITDDVLRVIANFENICNHIHLPVQSGSTRVLQRMNRTYTREWYLSKIKRIRELIPDCGITSDIITGFCSETEEDHQETLSLMRESRFDMSYMYFYSERPGTLAARRFPDDIPDAEKKRRLDEVVKLQNRLSQESNKQDIGTISKVLIEGDSKKSDTAWMGRNSQNKVVVFPKKEMALQKGDYALVKIASCTGATLIGHCV